MGSSSRSGSPQATRANQRWKEQWSTWVTRSTLIAVVVHAVLLLAWPAWNISQRFSPERTEFTQLEWVPFYGAFSGPEGTPLAAMPSSDALDVLPDEGSENSDPTLDDMTEALAERLSTLDYPVPSTANPSPRLEGERSRYTAEDRLILDQLYAHQPQIRLPTVHLPWPLLRNPNRVTRYLTSGGAADEMTEATRMVSVAMWIDERGSVQWAEVVHSSGVDAFDAAALTMFRDVAVFMPARDGRTTMPVSVIISVLF